MLSLENCLFNPSAQLHLVHLFQNAINTCKTTWSDDNELLYGTNDGALSCPKKRKKDNCKNTISSILAVDDLSESTHASTCPTDDINTIDRYLTWIKDHASLDVFQLTWCVLSIFYVSDDAKTHVSKYTHPTVAKAFFENYNLRFEVHLCGQLKHIKSEKKSTLIRQAKTPFEIVLAEWLIYKKLHMKIYSTIQ